MRPLRLLPHNQRHALHVAPTTLNAAFAVNYVLWPSRKLVAIFCWTIFLLEVHYFKTVNIYFFAKMDKLICKQFLKVCQITVSTKIVNRQADA